MLTLGSLVDGKYKILHVVGRGGTSVVYLAINEKANKQWAIKEIRKDGFLDFDLVRQHLITETETLKYLRHPYLPSIADIIDTGESFLIVMDYIEGHPLDTIIKEYGAQAQGDVIKWARQLCDVLGYLHSREPPIIYRDMKPANIMLKPDGNITLIDFGTARQFKPAHHEDTTCLGTRGYAAPEQYGGHGQTDIRTDIYCLGATLYHLITGHDPSRPPYEIVPVRRWNPSLSSGLEQIILRCTRSDPAERYQNCEELLYALNNYEKLDEVYRKSLCSRLKIFAAASVLTCLLGISTLFSGVYERSLTSQNYQGYLIEADQADTINQLETAIRTAVSLDRDNPKAYQHLLAWMTADNELTDEEKTTLESILYERYGGRQNIQRVRRHKAAYAEFSYQMGLAYFFYYKGSRGKNIARIWFRDLEDTPLNTEKKNRSKVYARIGSYYMSLGTEDRSGEKAAADYTRYFQDLVMLNVYSPEDLGTVQAAITLYCEITRQISLHANHFLTWGEGITSEHLNMELNKIQNRIQYLEDADPKKLDILKKNIEDARDNIIAASAQKKQAEEP